MDEGSITANKAGSWTEAKPIADIAGINPYSQCCNVSPDGRFLSYIADYTNEFGVYWADTKFINKINTESLSE